MTLNGWSDIIRQRFVALDITPRDADDLRGTVLSHHVGHLQVSTVTSTPQRFVRPPSTAAAEVDDVWALGLVEQGTGHLHQDGRTCVVTDGGFALYHTTRPFIWAFEGARQLRVCTWPRPSVALADTDAQKLTAVTVAGRSCVGTLLAPMIRQLSDRGAPTLSPACSVRLAGEIAEMAIIAAAEARGDDDRARSDGGLLRTVTTFIEGKLADPDLDADRIAREFFISTRTLHRLFTRNGLTVGAWIKSRRLAACRRALCSPHAARVPIGQIASRHGFTSASYFSREFANRFGLSPRQYRLHHVGR
ncbi:helix-turn-helix domain-containing protein [Pseudonocardia sp.]|uniref:helix-turn-helix domain-containing protein n=1 Tax=Pseudonocardia sp. TaxID=60912 RepID=UPI003D0A13FA